ncbi:hypothetical protein MNBD_GAMMA18-2319 [hydrothermal vent metagenome]|uniref:Uncharacterized protein n=1 Tax=hydrothermal vent metagenome TaxID=652676 RepID=A0A3B1A926_9ZZZZ
MKKNLIALAVAATMVPAIAAAEGASIGGYTDILWIHDNNNNAFTAAAEIDFRNTVGDVTVGVDVDILLGGTAGTALGTDEINLEQAFFAWNAVENVTVIAGLFNNPIGLDADDSIDQPTTQAGLIYGTLDAATALHVGNNISGLAVAYNAGVATITVGILNEITGGGNVSEFLGNPSSSGSDNSIALVVNASPIEGLDLEFGYVTMDDNTNLGDSAMNINVSFNTGPATITAEILDVDAWDDMLYGFGGYYDVMEGTQIGLRYESNSNNENTGGTEEQINLVAWHDLADNLTVGAGYNINTNGNGDDDEQAVIEFLAKF